MRNKYVTPTVAWIKHSVNHTYPFIWQEMYEKNIMSVAQNVLFCHETVGIICVSASVS